ncbi:MAG: hypothetical protein HCA25_19640 [Dolichospermum sp. DET50]|nr:hypothetical protein [Dolichospermum sp. DET66]MBS3034408.1 hypothetical protein [Dolichospermum sp. DET67]MBS3039611.1 hypothetical protein [Dolichospermum sp. DET50]QSX66821.1 MAG: hypothetical protein EZY12_18910 [Dolichospermum sp. DET69]
MKERHPYNLEAYSKLLSQHQPRVIKTEEENEHFLAKEQGEMLGNLFHVDASLFIE